jgi:hypothetical protein
VRARGRSGRRRRREWGRRWGGGLCHRRTARFGRRRFWRRPPLFRMRDGSFRLRGRCRRRTDDRGRPDNRDLRSDPVRMSGDVHPCPPFGMPRRCGRHGRGRRDRDRRHHRMRDRRFGQRRDRRGRMPQAAQSQGQGYQPDGAGSCKGANHVDAVSVRRQTMSAAASICRATGCKPTFVPSSPVETRSTTPQSQMPVASRPVRAASRRARSCGSPSRSSIGSSRMMIPRSYSGSARRPSKCASPSSRGSRAVCESVVQAGEEICRDARARVRRALRLLAAAAHILRRQRCSIPLRGLATSSGRSSSHAPAPASTAFRRTTSGTSARFPRCCRQDP